MNAYRVDILHIADSNTVACTVPHYLILDFLPSGDAALYKHLAHSGKTKAVFQNLSQLIFVVGDTAAASSKSISRTEDHRITYGLCKGKSILHRSDYLGSRNRFADFFHGIFEFLTVLRLTDGLRSRTDQTYMMFFQEAFFFQLHSKIQSGLTSQRRQHAVRFFLQDQLFHNLYSQRLNVNSVRNILICHNSGGIRVQQHYFNAFLFQGTAGLCSCIVEFRSLSNDNRTGTDHKDFFYLFISRHCRFLPSFP